MPLDPFSTTAQEPGESIVGKMGAKMGHRFPEFAI
jgi:hypothetical protein